jgi:D-alanyl-D-alanine carboxypeptidase
MKHFFRLTCIAIAIAITSYNSSGQKKDGYTAKIDSLIQLTNPRSFNGVVLIQQDRKTKYAKA